MKVAIFNIGTILSGDLTSPVAAGDTIVIDGDKSAPAVTSPAATSPSTPAA